MGKRGGKKRVYTPEPKTAKTPKGDPSKMPRDIRQAEEQKRYDESFYESRKRNAKAKEEFKAKRAKENAPKEPITPKDSKSVKPPKSAVGKKDIAAKRANASKQATRRTIQEVDLRSKATEAGKKIPKGKTARGMHAEEMLAKHFGKGGKAGVKGALGKAGAVAAAGLAGYAAGTALYKHAIKPAMDKSFEGKTKIKTAELKKQAEKEIADVRAKRAANKPKAETAPKEAPKAEKKIGEDVKQNGVTKSAVEAPKKEAPKSTPAKAEPKKPEKKLAKNWTPELNKLVAERARLRKEGKDTAEIQNKINEKMGSKVRHKVAETKQETKPEKKDDGKRYTISDMLKRPESKTQKRIDNRERTSEGTKIAAEKKEEKSSPVVQRLREQAKKTAGTKGGTATLNRRKRK